MLNSKAVGLVGTLGPNGAPQVSPVWYLWEPGRLRFQVRTDYQKYKNLQRDDRISIAIVDPENFGRYIEFRGRASISLERDDTFLAALARKYLGLDELPWETPDGSPTITVVPERIITMG